MVRTWTVVSGSASTEQDFITDLDSAMTTHFGWTKVYTVSDTSSDRNIVWSSEGETPGEYMTLYCEARGVSNDVQFYGETFRDTGGSVNDRIGDNQDSTIQWGGALDYWIMGNKDAVFVLNSDGYLGGFGYIDSYYTYKQDPYPMFLMGHFSLSYNFESNDRLLAYDVTPEAIAAGGGVDGGHFLGTVNSGSSNVFVMDNLNSLCQLGAPNPRDDKYALLKPVVYLKEGASLSKHEVRGEIPGIFQLYGDNSVNGELVTVSGVLNVDGEVDENAVFIIAKASNSNCYAIGPIEEL